MRPQLVCRAASLLVLADGRLPTGGHAHSGGLEEAVARGAVSDAVELERWLEGKLVTEGRINAAFAAASALCAGELDPSGRASAWRRWDELESELFARVPSQALRRASKAQGRGLLRVARRTWPSPVLETLWERSPEGTPWPLGLGAAAWAAGLGRVEAALAAAHGSVSGPGWAATKLTKIEPFAVAEVLARLAGQVAEVAERAARQALADPASLPRPAAPLLELGAEAHDRWEVRLFAS